MVALTRLAFGTSSLEQLSIFRREILKFLSRCEPRCQVIPSTKIFSKISETPVTATNSSEWNFEKFWAKRFFRWWLMPKFFLRKHSIVQDRRPNFCTKGLTSHLLLYTSHRHISNTYTEYKRRHQLQVINCSRVNRPWWVRICNQFWNSCFSLSRRSPGNQNC